MDLAFIFIFNVNSIIHAPQKKVALPAMGLKALFHRHRHAFMNTQCHIFLHY